MGNDHDQLIGKIYNTLQEPENWMEVMAALAQFSQPVLDTNDTSSSPSPHQDIEILISHLQQAASNAAYVHQVEDRHGILESVYDRMPWPLLMLTQDMCLADGNKAAYQLLAAGAPIHISPNKELVFEDKQLKQQVQEVLALARGRKTQLLTSALGELSLLCMPLVQSDASEELAQIRMMVWVLSRNNHAIPSAGHLQVLFQLTPAEARLLHLLCELGSLNACAEKLNISIHTARAHIKSIMIKVGVSSQVELVSHVMAQALVAMANFPLNAESPEYTLRLSDGRVLSWYEYGDPSGRPLLALENQDCSLPDHSVFADWYRQQKLRVIVVVRPGYGVSSPRPQLQFKDFSEDLRELCMHLGLNRPSMAAYCFGAAYALASAANDNELFERVGVLGTVVPIEHFELDRLDWMHGMMLKLYRRDPRLFRIFARLALYSARRNPEKHQDKMAKMLGGPDEKVLLNKDIKKRLLKQLKIRNFQGSKTLIDEYLLLQQPWQVDLSSINIPTLLWHGEQDPTISIGSARKLAAAIPGAHFKSFPDHGHFLVYDLWKDFVTELLSLKLNPVKQCAELRENCGGA